jgi:pullulanase/glycogen debranching enzyme
LKTSFYKLTKSKNSIAHIKIDHKKQEDTDQLQQNSYPLFLKLITKQPVFLLIITEQVILKIPRRNKNKQKQPISSSKEKSKKKNINLTHKALACWISASKTLRESW